MQHFESARLRFRPLKDSDVEDLMALEADPEVMRFLDGGKSGPPRFPSGDCGFMRPRGPTEGVWTILDKATGAFLGWVSLIEDPAAPNQFELGYRLCSAVWGKGFATEAAGGLISRTVRAGQPATIMAQTMAVNLRSRKVLEKLGFQHVRTVIEQWDTPLPGSELGEVIYQWNWPG